MNFHIVTIFPESLDSYVNSSILKRAQEKKKIKISFYNPREFATRNFGHIDGKPYGGGPGMVLEALPFIKSAQKAAGKKRSVKYIFFSPDGKKFDDAYAQDLAKNYKDVILLAGHYEGIDARAHEALGAEEVSIGDYVLTGGELPAMVLIDAVSRYVPGVLGNESSLEYSRASSSDVYTRPETFTYKGKSYSIPEILRTGHHKNIDEWREENRKGKKN